MKSEVTQTWKLRESRTVIEEQVIQTFVLWEGRVREGARVRARGQFYGRDGIKRLGVLMQATGVAAGALSQSCAE